jgi:hypothetical protein
MTTTISPIHGPARPGQTAPTQPPSRRREVGVGLLFLAATATFAAGDSLLESGPVLAATLQFATALAVAGTGLLLLPVLRPHAPRRARGYLLARLVECAALVLCGVYLVAAGAALPSYALIVYAVSAVAGMLLTHALLSSGLVPRWLAGLGLIGYASLLLGTALDLTGGIDLTTATGMAFLGPGGLFEIAFPVLLLARGFRR